MEDVKELLTSRGYYKNGVLDESALMAAASKEAMEFYAMLKKSKNVSYDFFKLADQIQDMQSKGLYELFGNWVQRICNDVAHKELDVLYLAALDEKVLERYSYHFCTALKLITDNFCEEGHDRGSDATPGEIFMDKIYFEELYRRKLINRKGCPVKNIVHYRSSLCAVMLAQQLYELDHRRVINGKRLMDILNTFYVAEDYEGVADVLYIVNEIFPFGIEELKDFRWLRGAVAPLYIRNFMERLKGEIAGKEADPEDE